MIHKSGKRYFLFGFSQIFAAPLTPVSVYILLLLLSFFGSNICFIMSVLSLFLGNDAAVPCTKTVDSFSFLHHPVHQRSLEILQRCKDEKYSKSRANIRFSFYKNLEF